MAKVKYRLEALVRVKHRARQRAEIALAKAIVALKTARERLKTLQDEKQALVDEWHRMRAEMDERMQMGGVVNDGTMFVNCLRRVKEDEAAKDEEITQQERVIERAEEQVVRRRRDYRLAAQELQVMEKHKELWIKREQAMLTEKEEKEFDELGQTIHELRKWKARAVGDVTQ